MPEFSIIVPVYNVEKYLNKCVDSILGQSFGDFELILIDDGSPDNCPAICDEYAKKDSRVKVIHKKNEGLSATRNAGLDVAIGEWIWFVDSDDCIHPQALEKAEKYLDGIDILNFGRIFYEDGEIADFTKNRVRYTGHTGLAKKEDICRLVSKACSTDLLPYVWRNIYNREFLNKNKLSFVCGLQFAEDSAFNMEAFLKADKIFFAEEYLYAYCRRLNSISKGRDKKTDLSFMDHFELYDKLRDENYKNFCVYPDDSYYEDAGEFILKTIYVYALLNRLYCSSSKNSFSLFKKISTSPMIKKALGRVDLNKTKSKSLDWQMLSFVNKGKYFLAFLIYRYFLFK